MPRPEVIHVQIPVWRGDYHCLRTARLGACVRTPGVRRFQWIRRSHRPYRDYYNPETRAIVEKIFREDLELFGYGF